MLCVASSYRRCPSQVVNRYIDEGVAELVPGVLFIDEVHLYTFIMTNEFGCYFDMF